ncbi:MAG TPA: hypothetical protein VKR56_09940 [Candidatus Cybelea sp.]|nr:hypothetical protein [Candidatus Cybelea sp.]
MGSSDLRNIAIASALALIVGLCAGTTPLSARADAACLAATQASYTVTVPGRPFAVREMPDSATAFVSINPETPLQVPGIAVLKCTGGRFAYTHTIPLSPQPTGLALTPDGKLLIVADDSYIAFLRTDRLSEDSINAITYVKVERGDIEDDDAGAIYVSVTPDGRYAFVSEEQAGTLTLAISTWERVRLRRSSRATAKRFMGQSRVPASDWDIRGVAEQRAPMPAILRTFLPEPYSPWTLQLPNEPLARLYALPPHNAAR